MGLHVPDASAWNFDAGMATHPRLDSLPTRARIVGGGGGGRGGSIVDTEKFEHIQMECENQTGEVARVKGSRGGRVDAGICVENMENIDRGDEWFCGADAHFAVDILPRQTCRSVLRAMPAF